VVWETIFELDGELLQGSLLSFIDGQIDDLDGRKLAQRR
jgi:hypothetical protein